MYPRTNYEMTKEEMKELLEACKPVPCMMIGGSTGPSPQENANNAWKNLGEKLGFDYDTVKPIPGKGTEFFSAVPSETEMQRVARVHKEVEEKRIERIGVLKTEIQERESELSELVI